MKNSSGKDARTRMASSILQLNEMRNKFSLIFDPSMPGIKGRVRAAMNALRAALLVGAMMALYRYVYSALLFLTLGAQSILVIPGRKREHGWGGWLHKGQRRARS